LLSPWRLGNVGEVDKRLVGIVSLGDLATHGSRPKTAKALHGISQPGGQHNQARAAAR
jgi:hypothetical protein